MSSLRRCLLKFSPSPLVRRPRRYALFHTSSSLSVLKPYILADIGEGNEHSQFLWAIILNSSGIKEVQIIQWFVEPEARVEQFDKICEVQSDKAAVDVGWHWTLDLKSPLLIDHG